MSDNVVPFKRAARSTSDQQVRPSQQASELDRAVRRLSSASHKGFAEADRRQLALNLGRLVIERGEGVGIPRSKLLLRAWANALPPPELPLSKRMRLVRFSGAECLAREQCQ